MSCAKRFIGSDEVTGKWISLILGSNAGASASGYPSDGWNSADQVPTQTKSRGTIMNSRNGDPKKTHGYAPVNGLKMYYEIEGTGDPLVCIPPAFGHAGVNSYPALVQATRSFTVDL